jgi:hypothetical protein
MQLSLKKIMLASFFEKNADLFLSEIYRPLKKPGPLLLKGNPAVLLQDPWLSVPTSR